MIERYSRPEMSRLWSDQVRYETWFEVELAVCRAMEQLGTVPAGTAEQVAGAVTLDAARILEIEQQTRHDVIAFLTYVEEQAGPPARWLHLGLTSSDVLDSAFALQLRRAGEVLLEGVDRLTAALGRRARELRDVGMVGRSHGIHAEPTSFGLALAGFYCELRRDRHRLASAVDEIAYGKLAGAVGVYGNVSPEVERVALGALGLRPETVATQVVPRDRHAALFNAMALVAAAIERIALQIRHWQRTEVAEASEPFRAGQKGSSAMPHKRNPILSENLCGLARLVRSHAGVALENIALWHERDISHSSVERVIAPDATTLLDFMLHRVTPLIDGLVVDRDRLAQNLELTGGLIFSEAVLLTLVHKGMARQRAYERVQGCAMSAIEGKGTFRDLLAADEVVSEKLSAEELSACFDLEHHLRHASTIMDRALAEDA